MMTSVVPRTLGVTLRVHLVMLVVAALVPAVAFAAFMIVLFAHQERAAVDRGVLETARALSMAVDKEIEASITGLQALSALPSLDVDDLATFTATARRLWAVHPAWGNLTLADARGRTLVDVRPDDGGGPTVRMDRSLVRRVVGSGEPTISDLSIDGPETTPSVVLAVAVKRGNRARYVLAAAFRLSGLHAILARQNLPQDWTGTVLDRKYTIIARSRAADRWVGHQATDVLVDRIRTAGEGLFEDATKEGIPSRGAFSRSSSTGWTVVIGVPAAVADTAIRRSIWSVTGAGVAVLLVGALLAMAVGRRIAAPIVALAASARAMAREGEIGPVPRSSMEEVRDLAGAIEEGSALLQARAAERRRVSELRDQVEAELRRANEAKDEFLAMLGHELRNPLGAINNAVKVLERVGDAGGQATALREIIARQSQHLARIVDDLLDVARATSGKITLRQEPVDLGEVAEHCVASLREAGRMARHDVRVETEPALVEGDRARLEQVTMNLLDNALKFTPEGGRIDVRVARRDDEALLTVRDSGVGIDAAMLPRIFELFAQGPRTLDRAQGGLGLGLALVERLVALHGGSIGATSEGRGRGSTFTVRLPALGLPAAAPASSPAPAEIAGPSRRIMVVEDNVDARESLRALLEVWGHRVETLEDGERAITAAAHSCPEVALIDIGLPGLDGYAVARRLKQTCSESTFLVALTGYGQPEDRRRAIDAGFDAHLVKPVDPDDLLRVLAMTGRQATPGR